MSYRFLPDLSDEQLAERQLSGLRWTMAHAFENNPHYRTKLEQAGISPNSIRSLDDIVRLPFTSMEDLQANYPLALLSVPEEKIVRIHASSGTTGKRKILAYTQADINTWKKMFARCYELAGLTTMDRVQISVGYGLWTAGAGFQLGCEHFGAMAVPIGPGNLEIQLQLLVDLKTTCLCSTASMALLMGEEVRKNNLLDKLNLHTCIFGSESYSQKMRDAFERNLGLRHAFDITGLTELYGPGIGLECRAHQGIHYWADLYILEIVDPDTLKPVPPGETGEMVITSLCKEAAPLIRYRTRDISRLIPGRCACGLNLPRHDRITGRSDDMIIFRGVNIYPGQIADALEQFPELCSEYQIVMHRAGGLDNMLLKVERRRDQPEGEDAVLTRKLANALHHKLLARLEVEIVPPMHLPRSFAKTKRVLDLREE